MDVEKIGKAIKELRQRAGYTQAELAECLGVTDKAVSRWERCLGIPDISLFVKLCNLLNTDVDNLLEGNITYLEHSWHGVLILDETDDEILPDTVIQGKRFVYIPVSYFLLAGIKHITVVGKEKYLDSARSVLGNGDRYGVVFKYCTDEKNISEDEHSLMVVHSGIFLFGPNLTRYFQRAILNTRGISFLTVSQEIGDKRVYFNNSHIIKKYCKTAYKYYKVPILFCKEKYEDIEKNTDAENSLCTAEPLGRGMIYRQIHNWKDFSEVSNFIRFVEESSGNILYCLEEIAWRRGLISKDELNELADEKTTFGKYILSITE